jgi:putative ABC transport system permease protein
MPASCCAGLAVGQLVVLLVTSPSAGLVGSAGTPVLSLATIGIVIGVVLAVAALATSIPVVRATRTSTVEALADAAHPPKRRKRTSAISARLPVPLLLGLRLAKRRVWRTVLSALGTAVTVSALGAGARRTDCACRRPVGPQREDVPSSVELRWRP